MLHDRSTNLDWRFPTGDTAFYDLIGDLTNTHAGNFAGFAYVGDEASNESSTEHAAWIAPLTADSQASAFAGKRDPAKAPMSSIRKRSPCATTAARATP